MAKGKLKRNIILASFILILAGLTSFFGIQFFTRTGIFHSHVAGKINYNASLDAETQAAFTAKLANLELEQDVNIELYRSTSLNTNDLLYNIYLPVTNFYSSISDISSTELSNETSEAIQLIPFSELGYKVKLLTLDNNYYLDSFDSGAYFDQIKITGENPEDVQKVQNLIQETLPAFPEKSDVLTFAQTGVTALSRRMNAKLNEVGSATYFAANIGEFLSSFDLTHTSNEASFSDYATSKNICAKPSMIDVLTAIGLDIVELTGNHNQDCGDDDALATLKKYAELGIKTVGGGESAVAAAVPLQITEKATNITLLAYNLSTGGYTLDETPGANFYTHEKALADIAAAKNRGDFIIIDIQYYECNNYSDTWDNPACDRADSSASDQVGFFRELIDMGADVVVGTAAHQPQTYELYHDGTIYYGLGNLFFDQSWWPGTQRSLILAHYFYHGKLLQTRILPTVYDDALQVKLMDDETAAWFLNRLSQVRPS